MHGMYNIQFSNGIFKYGTANLIQTPVFYSQHPPISSDAVQTSGNHGRASNSIKLLKPSGYFTYHQV
jgi:hypothetical protein